MCLSPFEPRLEQHYAACDGGAPIVLERKGDTLEMDAGGKVLIFSAN
jgi:hypothetical protein